MLLTSSVFAQLDTFKGSWPYPPFYSSQTINATFSEYRDTSPDGHFHNAVDIGEPDGNPCYPSMDGIVYSTYAEGTNAYIRIASKVSGGWKHLTYLHIRPNPALSIGDSVKKAETVVGTVVAGMGHVHLIERELVANIDDYGCEINNLRKNGGLTPYVDSWAPIINSNTLRFYTNGGFELLSANQLYGKVDIKIKIEEVNGSTSIGRNNGAYLAGYRVWNSEKSEIVFEPADKGIKYRFDYKPLNSDVHMAFVKGSATLSDPVYWLTNGDGANEINSSKTIRDNYFDASLLPEGNYQLEIFSEDTRDNQTNMFFPISIIDPAPSTPTIYCALNTDMKRALYVRWKKGAESDLVGYRLYYAVDDSLTEWRLVADESTLTKDVGEFSVASPADYLIPTNRQVHYYTITSVDESGQESQKSDLFAKSDLTDDRDYQTAMIINGFPKKDDEGVSISHNFIESYFAPLSISNSVVISSASKQHFLDDIDAFSLEDYDLIIWFTGDNTNHENTFQVKEMYRLAQYLDGGGNLFVSGSKIGYDLDERKSDFTDTLFYYQYLKSNFYYVGDELMKPALGLANSVFEDITLHYGNVAEEKYPDDIEPVNGSEVLFNYSQKRPDSTFRTAGVGFKGKFRESKIDGGLVYLSFPFETVSSFDERIEFLGSLFNYFGLTTDLDSETNFIPNQFALEQNYPNPFNPATTISYSVPNTGKATDHKVRLVIYNVLGQEVAVLIDREQKPGSYQAVFNASVLSSGPYFARLTVNDISKTISMMLIK